MSLLLGWGHRIRRWPKFRDSETAWVDNRPSDIKVVTTNRLEELMALAARRPGVSSGRPAWLEEHRSQLGAHYIVAAGPQPPEHYLCFVTSELAGEPTGYYRLDIPQRTFHALPDISPDLLLTFAHRNLTALGPIPPDPGTLQADDDFLRGLDDH